MRYWYSRFKDWSCNHPLLVGFLRKFNYVQFKEEMCEYYRNLAISKDEELEAARAELRRIKA